MNAADREKTCLPLLEGAADFGSLPREALRFVAAGCHTRTATRDQVLCERGQPLAGFFIVVSGRVKLSILSVDGAERVLAVVLPGQTLAEAAAFLEEPCPLHAQALTDARLLFVSQARLRAAIERWPEVAHLMLAIVARRAHALIQDLEACCLHSAAERVTGFLLREAQIEPLPSGHSASTRVAAGQLVAAQVRAGDDLAPERLTNAPAPGDQTTNRPATSDHAQVQLAAAKTVIASSLNLTPETFSRELHGLARRGLIVVERRQIRIPSLARLRAEGGQGLAFMRPPGDPAAQRMAGAPHV